MSVSDPTIEELRGHLRWPVYRTEEGYLIGFSYSDMTEGRIHGVGFETAMNPCILSVKSFDQVPLIFVITQPSMDEPSTVTELRYHVLNRVPHRIGKPATYKMNSKEVAMRYFRHGVPHRDDGPYAITMTNPKWSTPVDLDGNKVEGFVQLDASKVVYEWCIEGVINPLNCPSEAVLWDARLIYNDRGNLQDIPGKKAVLARTAHWWWNSNFTDPMELRPYRFRFEPFEESHDDGKLIDRVVGRVNTRWIRHGINEPEVTLDDFPSDYFISRMNLWFGEFLSPGDVVKLEHEFHELKT